ncbi:hypothetical protein CY34DRAFT_804334 [Suillus luteus UH-Slu-Lm8-n1]|uniref:Uncharacterized protein n=1 Tax=Suillus luteus UH-Slu-Lm8-n1 TaxID=930992 RepID=A0A0C9ZZ22_9AGAM|nr:hypothetical protein CY34DRAFT_804334 [Suillus luteus UH-Slu-Lm8-n1]
MYSNPSVPLFLAYFPSSVPGSSVASTSGVGSAVSESDSALTDTHGLHGVGGFRTGRRIMDTRSMSIIWMVGMYLRAMHSA